MSDIILTPMDVRGESKIHVRIMGDINCCAHFDVSNNPDWFFYILRELVEHRDYYNQIKFKSNYTFCISDKLKLDRFELTKALDLYFDSNKEDKKEDH